MREPCIQSNEPMPFASDPDAASSLSDGTLGGRLLVAARQLATAEMAARVAEIVERARPSVEVRP